MVIISYKWKRHILRQKDYQAWTLRHKWMGKCKFIVPAVIIFWIVNVAFI